MILEIISATTISIGALAVLILLLKKPISCFFQSVLQKIMDENLKAAEQRGHELFKEERERVSNQLVEKLKQGEQFIDHKKDSIKELVEKIHAELSKNQEKLEHTEKERIVEFTKLETALSEYKGVTGVLSESTHKLRNILSDDKQRGKFGEEIAENLLKSVGFVKGINYEAQKGQEDSDDNKNQPDLTIILPDKTKINVDAKFPFQSLIRYQESDDKQEQKKHLSDFEKHVTDKIDKVVKYINPKAKTVDFAILFIPNEGIFSFICEHLDKARDTAMKKKIIMAGPSSFIAISRMILQAHKNFKYQENSNTIIDLIKTFEQEFEKFTKELDALGKQIRVILNQYETVSGPRAGQLSRVVKRISNIHISFEAPETESNVFVEPEPTKEEDQFKY